MQSIPLNLQNHKERFMREFRGKAALIIGALYAVFVLWSLYGAIMPVETYTFRMVHLLLIFVLAFLVMPVSKNAGRWGLVLDVGLAALGAVTVLYALVDVDGFIRRSTVPLPLDFIFGLVAILLLVELSRRTVGNTFTIILSLFLAYAYLGYFIPGMLGHKGYDLDRIIGHLYMTLEGMFGVPLSVSVSFVILFVVFGTFMDVAGAGKFWLELSLAVMGRGPASAGRGAVVTSALLGGPQASGVATTMSVAPIMWPILKNAGYSANMAAGLISAGGIGAVISPPLMGAAAFLIMQFLGISFWSVVVMVIVPTLLYYLGTLFMVEMEARKYHFKPPESSDLTFGQVMRARGHHLISLAVLMVLLGMGLSSEVAAIWAIVTVIATSFLSKDRSEWLTPRRIVLATIEGAKNMLPVAVLLAAAGLIVGVFSLTGLGLKISTLIMSASGGNLILALLLALLASMVIGLSLPITATYIMTVVMVAPALVKVGVPEHVAHLLVFYFAVLSEVSPPVGLSPSAAAAITGGDPFGAMMQAWKYSLPAFLVPFLFSATAQGASLLLTNTTLDQFIPALLNSLLALFFLSSGIIGYLRAPLNLIERALLIAAACLMVISPLGFTLQSLLPLAVALLVLGRHIFATRNLVLG
jgi:TRAP transporter 4TM/12TM fusion protein